MRFSKPYYLYKLQLVVRAGEQRLTTLQDCVGRPDLVIGTLEDTAAERLLDKLGIKKKIYPGQVEPYADLASGRIDGVLLDLPIALYYAKKNPQLRFAGEPIAPGFYAIAFRPTDAVPVRQVDAALDRLWQKGDLRRIYEKWGIWNADQDRLWEGAGNDVAEEASRSWSFDRYFPLLVQGAGVTILVTVLSMVLAVLLGMPIALIRLYGPAPLRWLALLYVEFFRGIPVLLLLFFLYWTAWSVRCSWGRR